MKNDLEGQIKNYVSFEHTAVIVMKITPWNYK